MQGGHNNNDDDDDDNDDVKTWIFNTCIVKWDEMNQRWGHLQGSQVGTACSLVNLQESGISDGIWSLEGIKHREFQIEIYQSRLGEQCSQRHNNQIHTL